MILYSDHGRQFQTRGGIYHGINRYKPSYSETTWAVGIAQLTHHEVQGGGKNPETGGRGIFAPTANRVVS